MDNNVNIKRYERWYSMPVGEQLLNVGSEVHRALRWKSKNDDVKASNFCGKAIEFLSVIKDDPKNSKRVHELEACITELEDYFYGENLYNTTAETLIRYYDSFLGVYEKAMSQMQENLPG